MYRAGLARALRERVEIRVIGEASTGREALELIRETCPTVALLDLTLPDIDGLSLLESIRLEHLPSRVIFLSAREDSATVYQAMSFGADAYLAKTSTATEIVNAVVAVARGETVIPPLMQRRLVDEIRLRRPTDDRPTITQRELEVLQLSADGLTAAEIGERLHLSRTTIRTHLQHIYDKLGVADRTAAVAHALRSGILR